MVQELSSAELGEIYAFALQLGKDAGNMLMDFARARWSDPETQVQAFIEKDSAVDIVTKADEGTCAAPGSDPMRTRSYRALGPDNRTRCRSLH